MSFRIESVSPISKGWSLIILLPSGSKRGIRNLQSSVDINHLDVKDQI